MRNGFGRKLQGAASRSTAILQFKKGGRHGREKGEKGEKRRGKKSAYISVLAPHHIVLNLASRRV